MEWYPDPDLRGWFTMVPLSNGQDLQLGFFMEDEGFEDPDGQIGKGRGCVNVTMIALDKDDSPFCGDHWQAVEGTPTGPGGLEAWSIALGAWDELEDMVRREWPKPVPIAVGASSAKLMRLYERLLKPKGYTRIGGEMVKWSA